jgi:hypothetical protein
MHNMKTRQEVVYVHTYVINLPKVDAIYVMQIAIGGLSAKLNFIP